MPLITSTSQDSFAFSPRITMAAFPVSEQIIGSCARHQNCSCPCLILRSELERGTAVPKALTSTSQSPKELPGGPVLL